jgi:hypothetical protein
VLFDAATPPIGHRLPLHSQLSPLVVLQLEEGEDEPEEAVLHAQLGLHCAAAYTGGEDTGRE